MLDLIYTLPSLECLGETGLIITLQGAQNISTLNDDGGDSLEWVNL